MRKLRLREQNNLHKFAQLEGGRARTHHQMDLFPLSPGHVHPWESFALVGGALSAHALQAALALRLWAGSVGCDVVYDIIMRKCELMNGALGRGGGREGDWPLVLITCSFPCGLADYWLSKNSRPSRAGQAQHHAELFWPLHIVLHFHPELLWYCTCDPCYFCLGLLVLWSPTFLFAPPATWR